MADWIDEAEAACEIVRVAVERINNSQGEERTEARADLVRVTEKEGLIIANALPHALAALRAADELANVAALFDNAPDMEEALAAYRKARS